MKGSISVVLLCLGPGLGLLEAGPATSEGEEDGVHVRMSRSRDGFVVTQAVRGALRRLGDARCQAVFSDFSESSGRRLQEVLDDQGLTGQDFLGLLMFYDGAQVPQCRKPGVLAFTAPGSHVVYICTGWFRETFELNPARTETVIIHESLHSLGLGENPPSSHEITERVLARCGL
jgi:hypothetical protein